jgi:hypothetical protein
MKLKLKKPKSITPVTKIPDGKKKFFDLYEHGVTQSLIGTWLRCPTQAYLRYVEGWTSYKKSDAIFFGEICHHVLAKAYATNNVITEAHVKKWLAEYKKQINHYDAPTNIIEQNEIIFAKAEAVMSCYFVFYANDVQKEWIFAEENFKIPYVFPDGKTTWLRGRIDGAFKASKGNWLMDHKTMGRIVIEDTITLLPVDLQVNFYLYAGEILGLVPRGFYYNIIRNPQKKPHKSKNETLAQYVERLKKDIEKSWEDNFYRIQMPITSLEIIEWKQKTLDPIMRDIRKWYDSDYKWPGYFDPTALRTHYGGLAEMAELIINNDHTYYVKREHLFAELE